MDIRKMLVPCADVTLYAPNTGGHGETALAMMTVTNGWIAARLLGLPTTTEG